MFRVLAWATKPLLGVAAQKVAETWEAKRRPSVLRMGLPGAPIADWPAVDWGAFPKGERALLLVHGTFSTARGGFAGLQGTALPSLFARYDNRVLAFDHPTLSQSPAQNAETLVKELPSSLRFDLITHSRGGLVACELLREAERHADLTPERAVLVAGPLQGTRLTDAEHMVEMLDRYTQAVAELPDGVFTGVIEGILMAVKLVANAALSTLPGLAAMHPAGPYVTALTRATPSTTRLYAIAASYTPDDPAWLLRLAKRVGDAVVDRVFGVPNDLVVPTAGAHGAPGLTMADELVLGGGVNHMTFFADPQVQAKLLDWLS